MLVNTVEILLFRIQKNYRLILDCTVLYSSMLYCAVLYSTVLYSSVLYSSASYANPPLLQNIVENKVASEVVLNKIIIAYGQSGHARSLTWLDFIKQSKSLSINEKIITVNDLVNDLVHYRDDHQLWSQKDYWANVFESSAIGYGDCEDYAIAKFFILNALDVPTAQLRLMYVRQLTVNQPHMVLIYSESPTTMPVVLDNYDPVVKKAHLRKDLKPIYSFNSDGLWLAKSKGMGKKVENSKGVSAWVQLIDNTDKLILNTPLHIREDVE